jgi:hypothetical protein
MRVPKSKELADKLQSITSPGRKKKQEARADKQAATQDWIPRNKSREEVATGFD